ncbi:MAG: hypothetical protein ACLSB9_33960 [Hydrogeniiclostridium mannosilyticum]
MNRDIAPAAAAGLGWPSARKQWKPTAGDLVERTGPEGTVFAFTVLKEGSSEYDITGRGQSTHYEDQRRGAFCTVMRCSGRGLLPKRGNSFGGTRQI